MGHPRAGNSTNKWLRIVHNRAPDLGWLLAPVLARKIWPAIRTKEGIAITFEQHRRLIEAEVDEEFARHLEVLWENGGARTDIACLVADQRVCHGPRRQALIVALHHPIYSFDDHHSGSPRIADVVQHACNDSRRLPNLVMSAHVHNYQRIKREIEGAPLPFIVVGHGGYYHLHGMQGQVGGSDS